jgi:arylsulfatase A-like enzyme
VLGGGRGDTTILWGTEPTPFTHTIDDFGREAVSFIERHRAQPWFVYLAFNAVHGPMESTEKYLSRFTSLESPKRHTFAAMLSAMDDNVGLVLTKIRELSQEENTLIVFFSDNGGPTPQSTASNGPLRGYKSQTWEGGIRIPFIVQWKGRLPAGKVNDRPIIQLDILPTALAAAGVEAKPEWKLDGVNLLPYLTGEKAGVPHTALYWRFGWQYALRMGDWKIVKATTGKDFPGGMPGDHPDLSQAELYNLAHDIGEKNNLAAAEPEKLKEMIAVWSQWNSQLIEPRWYHPLPAGKKARKKQQAGD